MLSLATFACQHNPLRLPGVAFSCIPAQIWRLNEKHVSKFYVEDKKVASIKLDPMRETAGIDETNNYCGKLPEPSKFQVFKQN